MMISLANLFEFMRDFFWPFDDKCSVQVRKTPCRPRSWASFGLF
jgi:hypothetical protein